jgi:hypothetical protein
MSAAAFARLNAAVVRKFGDPVEILYTPQTGQPVNLSGIRIDPATQESVSPGVTMLLFLDLADFGSLYPLRGDSIGFAGKTYDVAAVGQDAIDGITLGLKQKA